MQEIRLSSGSQQGRILDKSYLRRRVRFEEVAGG